MNIVTHKSIGRGVQSATFEFIGNKVDEGIDVSSQSQNYIILKNGYVVENSQGGSSITIGIVGGDDRFEFEKGDREQGYELTTEQYIAVSDILKGLAMYNAYGSVTSGNDVLEPIVTSLYGAYTN